MAESKEVAIAALEPMFYQRMERIEVIPVSGAVENPWADFYGVLKDDVDFQEWANHFWSEKQQRHDDEPILSIEECLQVM